MRRLVWIAMVVCALAVPAALQAQFGHPLKGQWSGEWGPKDKPNRLLLNFDWDGKEITGTINPGPNAAVVKSVVFDYTNPSSWGVKITAEGKDASGQAGAHLGGRQAREHRRLHEAPSRHLDAGRPEGRLRRDQELTARLIPGTSGWAGFKAVRAKAPDGLSSVQTQENHRKYCDLRSFRAKL